MGSLFEFGISWFAKEMETSASGSDCVKSARHILQIGNADKLFIKSGSADIKVLCAADNSFYSVVVHPDLPADAIKITVTSKDDTAEITIREDREMLGSHNAAVLFQISSAIDALTIKSEAGDITLSACQAKETSITSVSGDITVCGHVVPCQAEVSTKHGDVTRAGFVSKPSEHKLICKTTDGDIVLSQEKQL